jgi:hypothetical protein
MLWLRRLVAGLSPRGPVFIQSGTATLFSPSSSVFPCQYQSTVALHTYISPGVWTIAPWWSQSTDIVSPHRHERQQPGLPSCSVFRSNVVTVTYCSVRGGNLESKYFRQPIQDSWGSSLARQRQAILCSLPLFLDRLWQQPVAVCLREPSTSWIRAVGSTNLLRVAYGSVLIFYCSVRPTDRLCDL